MAIQEAAFDGGDDESSMVRAAHDRGAVVSSLVAEVDGQVVGHVLVTPMTTDGTSLVFAGLAPVAVHPGHQGRGIGSTLVRAAIGEAAGAGVAGVVVLGDPGYYGRLGFRIAAEDGVTSLDGYPAEYLQVYWLDTPAPAAVAYHPVISGR